MVINFNNLVTIITSLIINFLIFVFLLYKEIKSPKTYKGLNIWLTSSVIRFIAILLSFIFYNETINGFHLMTYISYTLNIISFSLLGYSLYKFINKEITNLGKIILIFPIPVLITFAIINNITIFILITTILVVYYSIVQLIIINKNTDIDIKSNWTIYTYLQVFITLFVTLYLILRTIGFKDNLLELINYSETNIIIKSIVLLSVMNSMLTVLSLEMSYFLSQSRITKFFQMLVELSDLEHMIIDSSTNKIIEVKKSLINKLGYKNSNELIGINFDNFIKDKEKCNNIKEKLSKSNSHIEEITINSNDNLISYNVLFRNISFQNKTYCLLNFDQQVVKNKEYKKMAYEDELTKLPNRRKIYELFEEYKELKETFYLVFIDIDNFKKLNDTKGHLYGDLILETIGYELNKYNDKIQLAARYGGDEFILLIPNNDKNKNIELTIEKLNNLFKNKIEVNNEHIEINVSIGYSKYPVNGTNIEELILFADKKLYKEKKIKKIMSY